MTRLIFKNNIKLIAFLFFLYGGAASSGEISPCKEGICSFSLSDFIHLAYDPNKQNKEYYYNIIGKNKREELIYNIFEEKIIYNLFFKKEKIDKIILTQFPGDKNLLHIKMNFEKNNCLSVFEFMDIMERFPLRQYHRILANPHDTSFRIVKRRVYVWHPHGIEVIMEADINFPNCVSYISLGFDQKTFEYIPVH